MHLLGSGSSADTIRPSLIIRIVDAQLATSGSCVTITIAWPCLFSSRNVEITVLADLRSRLPVGSSANSSSGSPTIALAMATRCC